MSMSMYMSMYMSMPMSMYMYMSMTRKLASGEVASVSGSGAQVRASKATTGVMRTITIMGDGITDEVFRWRRFLYPVDRVQLGRCCTMA